MTPLEEQASRCHTMAQGIDQEINTMNLLLHRWQSCDRSDTDNHWMYHDLQQRIADLNEQVENYSQEVTQAELLEGLHEKGDIILN